MQTYVRYSAIALVPLVVVGAAFFLLGGEEENDAIYTAPEEVSAWKSQDDGVDVASPDGSACVTGGCSGQICGEADEVGGIITTCEYREEYTCLKKYSTCERNQSTGKCAWTQTKEFTQCVSDTQQNIGNVR